MTETEIVQSDESYADILPSFDEVISDELLHDGHTVWEWQFSQLDSLATNTIVDPMNKEIVCDLTKLEHYIYNQFKLGKDQ